MFPVPHRHFVMSVPDALWPFLKNPDMWKAYMDSAIEAIHDYFPKIVRGKIKVGVIVFLHPFGKDAGFRPHLHLIITEGGFDSRGKFIKKEFIPADGLRKCWMYHVLKMLQKKGLPNELAAEMYARYKNGFYVWLHKAGRISHPRIIAKYVGRYVRHPAIANSRIFSYDGHRVGIFWTDKGDNLRHETSMPVDEFISSLIQHIPPQNFRMVRYYGAYARRAKRRFGSLCQSGMRQLNLHKFGLERISRCPFCGSKMEFIWYSKKPPPEEIVAIKEQRELTDWLSVNALRISHRR